jgi:hypothetical protein
MGDQMKRNSSKVLSTTQLTQTVADLLSRPAIECLGSTIAGWPLDALGVRSLEMVGSVLPSAI